MLSKHRFTAVSAVMDGVDSMPTLSIKGMSAVANGVPVPSQQLVLNDVSDTAVSEDVQLAQ